MAVSGFRVVVLVLLFTVNLQAALAALATTVPLVTAPLASECNNNGHIGFVDGPCVCLSGLSGVACETVHNLTSVDTCAVNVAHNEHQKDYLRIDTEFDAYQHDSPSTTAMGFFADHLALGFRGHLVNNRQFHTIGWKDHTNENCTLGSVNSFWSQDVDLCEDTFVLDMPWKHHASCGFQLIDRNEERGGFATYKATLIAAYVDEIPAVYEGLPALHRSTRMYVNVFLKFPTNLDVEIETSNITSPYVQFPGITQFYMDNTDGLLHMTLTTVTTWPNTLTTENLALDLPPGLTLAPGTQITFDWSACTNTSYSPCVQTWSVVLVPDDCVFDGEYVFHFTITSCREQLALCQKKTESITFTVVNSNNCGVVTIVPTISGTLNFVTQNLTTPADSVNVGSTGYFVTRIVSENNSQNDITMEYEKIWFKDPSKPSRTYILLWNTTAEHHVAYKPDFDYDGTTTLAPLALQVDNVAQSFSVFFHGSLFKVNPNQIVNFVFGAQIKIKYAGNLEEEAANYPITKRMVLEQEFTYKAPKKDAAVTFSVNAKVAQPASAVSYQKSSSLPSTSNLIVSIVVPLAAVALITVIAVVAYVVKTKNSYAKIPAETAAAL